MINNNMRHAFPGITFGVAAFAAYIAYDQATGASKKAHTD